MTLEEMKKERKKLDKLIAREEKINYKKIHDFLNNCNCKEKAFLLKSLLKDNSTESEKIENITFYYNGKVI